MGHGYSSKGIYISTPVHPVKMLTTKQAKIGRNVYKHQDRGPPTAYHLSDDRKGRVER